MLVLSERNEGIMKVDWPPTIKETPTLQNLFVNDTILSPETKTRNEIIKMFAILKCKTINLNLL